MELQPDFKELLQLFNKHKVDYLIVGGYALAQHGAPRYTGDLDLFVRPASDNAKKIMAALNEFGFGGLELSTSDFEQPGKIVQLGVPPVRVDLITSITGVSWQQAVEGKVLGSYGDVPVGFIGKQQFLTNKRAVGRKKDQADLESLGEQP